STSMSSVLIKIAGNTVTIASDNGPANPRNLITPGEALAVYQVSRDSALTAQTVGLNALGQVTSINPATSGSPSVFTTGSREQLLPFTSFAVAAADVANQVQVKFQGAAPIVDLTNVIAPKISGTVAFTTPNAQPIIDLGSKALTVAAGATIQANAGG